MLLPPKQRPSALSQNLVVLISMEGSAMCNGQLGPWPPFGTFSTQRKCYDEAGSLTKAGMLSRRELCVVSYDLAGCYDSIAVSSVGAFESVSSDVLISAALATRPDGWDHGSVIPPHWPITTTNLCHWCL